IGVSWSLAAAVGIFMTTADVRDVLWDIFAKICSIPHPSYHEEQLAEHIMGWAKEKGLHAERDQVGNILIRKGADYDEAHLVVTLDLSSR
ncbi:hypothetical protein FK521_27500, partial [Klebsiella pneumoniae]|nr:hypothetical protein [Klebsiella pneumoniae]